MAKNAVVSPDGVLMLNAQIDVDARKQKLYTSVEDANTSITSSFRKEGLKILLKIDDVIVPYMWQGGIADKDLKPAPGNLSLKYQDISSGGNYHNLVLTGNILVFEFDNAQAIITGFDGSKYKRITIINNSDFELRFNAEDANSIPENQIKLPTGLASIGVDGTCEMIYVESVQKWQIIDSFASKYRPEHRGLTETRVETVTPEGISETQPIIELEVFRDSQATVMSKADLNTAYPEAKRGFMVICKQIDTIYKKVDDNSNDWVEYHFNAVV